MSGDRCGMHTASGHTCLFPQGHLGSCESPYAMRQEQDRLRSLVVSRLMAEEVELLTETTVRDALAPCVGGTRLVEAGLEFLRDGSLAKAMRAARGVAPRADDEKAYKIAIIRDDARRYWLGAGPSGVVDREEDAHVYANSLAFYIASEQVNRTSDRRTRAVIMIEVEKADGEWRRAPNQPWGAGI